MHDLWAQCLKTLKEGYAPEIFTNWFSELTAEVEEEAGSITILAPSSTKLRTVQSSYGSMISQLVNRTAGREMDIQWGVRTDTPVAVPSPAVAEADRKEIAARHSEKELERIRQAGLLPNLSFENMVEGQANQMAYAAALQVSSSPQSIYNPLFIYGGVGLGKTHLMHAIGLQYLKQHPNARVLCVSAQQYMSEYTNAMRMKSSGDSRFNDAMAQFDSRYQGLDMLLIDDIQSFGNREGTQTNFFLAFESMVPRGKQIVLTSDTYPRNLKDFQERLLSRLTQGLIVSVEPPEFDMRVHILMQKADRSNLDMPLDVAEVIAKKLKSNVRELEGAVQQILAYTKFHNLPVTIDSVKMALKDLFKASSVPVTVENIQQIVADHFNLKVADINSKSRKANLVRARQIAMYLSKDLTTKSLPELGSLFGGRDHTTVMYACRKVAEERSTNEELKHDLHLLQQRIKN